MYPRPMAFRDPSRGASTIVAVVAEAVEVQVEIVVKGMPPNGRLPRHATALTMDDS